MNKHLRTLALIAGIGLTLLYLAPTHLSAQSEDQQAYQAGYQNGIAAARNHQAMHPDSDDWHGNRREAYERGYQEGYRSVEGHERWEHHEHDAYQMPERWEHDAESQKAYQTGFANGVTDAQNRRGMHPNSEDWHGERLTAYQEGYERGYHSGGR